MATLAPQKVNRKLATAGLRTFFNIAKNWKLNTTEQMTLLGLNSNSTYHKWKNDPTTANLDNDNLERLSYIMGIYKDLQTLLSDTVSADAWIKTANTAAIFGGRPPIERICQGKIADLYIVRQYLARERGI